MNFFGNQFAMTVPPDPRALSAAMDAARALVKRYAPATPPATADEGDRQLTEATRGHALAVARLNEAEARRRTAELAGDAKALAAVTRELSTLTPAAEEAADLLAAARTIFERRQSEFANNAEATRREAQSAILAAIVKERAACEKAIEAAVAPLLAKLAALQRAEAVATFGSLGSVANFAAGMQN